jgi:hypothetical protein
MGSSAELAVSAGSLVVAIVAVLFSVKSYANTKITTAIATDDHRQRNAQINPYLIDGFSWRQKNNNRKCFFAISLANSSVAPTSIVKAELHLKLYAKDGAISQVILQPTIFSLPGKAEVITMIQPINLDAGSTRSVWISYEIPEFVTGNFKIDIYEVVFTSGNGFRVGVQQYVMKEIEIEEGKS